MHYGESVLDPVVIRSLLERVSGRSKESAKVEGRGPLSQREVDILKLVAKGMNNEEVANELFLSVRTVKAHLTNIFNKFGVGCRTEAIIRGLREGYITLEDAVSNPISDRSFNVESKDETRVQTG